VKRATGLATLEVEEVGTGLAASTRGLDPLRRRLAGATAREAVLVDFLEDDLREAEAAVADVAAWLRSVGERVRDPAVSRHDLMGVAARSQGADEVEYLGAVLANVRRRVAQVAVSLQRSGR
jgi:hypothetical protein